MTNIEIWVNIHEKTGQFLGAYSTMDRALDASIGSLNNIRDEIGVITFQYDIDMPLGDGILTVEDILNGKSKE